MCKPKLIEDITLEDLSRNQWCYFHDDDEGYDGFEWAIPDDHPDYSDEIMGPELAIFRFRASEQFTGMFDGASCFTACLAGEWYSFWCGVGIPSELKVSRLNDKLNELGLLLPVVATAKWSHRSETYNGIRYFDETGNEVEAGIGCNSQ